MTARHLHHRVAGLLFPRYSRVLDAMNHNARLSQWMRDNRSLYSVPDRFSLYRFVQTLIDGPIDYLEFGVFRGESLRKWVEINTHPESRFYGFDSFKGLPEDWNPTDRAGTFDTGGEIPRIDDSRVRIVPGLFNDTIPEFLRTFTPRSPLVVNNDSDLYSSTAFVLAKLDPLLVPGSVVVFDEFYSALHEFRAWSDYCSAFRRSAHPIARANDPAGRVAFRF